MLGNVITSPTFRFLKVNDVEIDKINYKIPKWTGDDIIEDVNNLDERFKDVKFGVNDEIVNINKEKNNSKKYLSINGDRKEKIIYKFTGENKVLFDEIKIDMQKSSKAEILIDYSNIDIEEAIRNSCIYVHGGEDSELNLYLISRQKDSDKILQSIGVVTKQNAKVNIYHVELSSRFKAFSIRSYLKGDNSRLTIQGIYFLKGDEKADLLYNTEITGKNCKNYIKISGVQKDNSHKTFKGTIDFKKGCSHSIGDESEYVTLLNGDPVSRSLPILLSREENVRGNHAASVGKIDKEKLFYIMSRGLSEKEASNLIIMAELAPVIDKIPDEKIKEDIAEEIYRGLDH